MNVPRLPVVTMSTAPSSFSSACFIQSTRKVAGTEYPFSYVLTDE
jgi:hypothetical protein